MAQFCYIPAVESCCQHESHFKISETTCVIDMMLADVVDNNLPILSSEEFDLENFLNNDGFPSKLVDQFESGFSNLSDQETGMKEYCELLPMANLQTSTPESYTDCNQGDFECDTNANYMLSGNNALKNPINFSHDFIEVDLQWMTSNFCYQASSSGDSDYLSASDGNSRGYSPVSSSYNSISSASLDVHPETYEIKIPKTISFYETRYPYNLEKVQESKRGRPRQKTEVYDAEIFKALADDDYEKLKVARNKKSSQVYRLNKKRESITLQNELSAQLKLNFKLTRKLNKLDRITGNLKNLLNMKN